jgi:large subunit ribosomal protein L23
MAFNFFNKNKKKKIEPVAPSPVEADTQAPMLAAPTSGLANEVLKRYFVSEKSTRGFAENQYTFEVDRHATKTAIRDAVERSYHVDVIAVNTVRLPTKSITVGRHKGTKGGIKKAIVTLKEGQSIAQAQP